MIIPFGPLVQRFMMPLSAKRRRALLRNSLYRHQLKSEFSCLCAKPISLAVLNAALLLLEDCRVILLLARDHVVDNTRQLVRDSGDRFRRAEAGLHPAEILAEERLALVQCLGGESQRQRRAILGGASLGREHLAAADSWF